MNAQTRTQGTNIENLAAVFLEKKGLNLLHKNFICRMGEIDIICKDKEHLVFVEVRYRAFQNFGGPAASVNSPKQRKIIKTAKYFLKTRKWANQLPCRFDVMAISESFGSPDINWIKNAFQ